MMNTLRKNMKVILWIVVLAFVATIFFVWGMDGGRQQDYQNQQAAAVVNDEPISYLEYDRLWDQQSQEIFGRSQEEPTPAQVQRLRNDLISELIDRVLLRQQFEKLDLKIHPEEVAARIAAMPAFQDQGKFSQEKYFSLLQYNRINPQEFEADQQSSLAILKMDRLLRDNSLVAEDSLRAYFLSRSRLLKLNGVAFNWKTLTPNIVVPEQELTEYFNKHKNEYDQPAEVRASHILVKFEANASEEQKLTAKLKAENLRAEIVKGADFAAVAAKNSDDPGSKEKGGDLGFFKPGVMVPSFEKAAFSLKVNELSNSIESPFGYHIIKVSERREAKPAVLAEVRGKILQTLREEKAREQALNASKAFMTQLKLSQDVVKAAQASGAKVIATDWVKVDGAIAGLEKSEAVLDRAFDLPVGKPSSAINIGDGVAFVQVAAERYQPFDEARYQLTHDTLLEKYKDLHAEQVLMAWLQNAKAKAKIVNNIQQEKSAAQPEAATK